MTLIPSLCEWWLDSDRTTMCVAKFSGCCSDCRNANESLKQCAVHENELMECRGSHKVFLAPVLHSLPMSLATSLNCFHLAGGSVIFSLVMGASYLVMAAVRMVGKSNYNFGFSLKMAGWATDRLILLAHTLAEWVPKIFHIFPSNIDSEISARLNTFVI